MALKQSLVLVCHDSARPLYRISRDYHHSAVPVLLLRGFRKEQFENEHTLTKRTRVVLLLIYEFSGYDVDC